MWIKSQPSKGPEARIPGPLVTLVVDGNSQFPGSLPDMNYLDLRWFYATPNFAIAAANPTSLSCVAGLSGHGKFLFHHTKEWIIL